METAKLTLRLPKQDLEFAETYARKHRMTVSKLIDQLLQRFRKSEEVRSAPASGDADSWQDFFQIGDELATTAPPRALDALDHRRTGLHARCRLDRAASS